MNAFEGKIHFNSSGDDGESTKYTVSCVYQTDGENAVISFIEPKEENKIPTNTRIFLTEDSVIVRRNGEMKADFEFVENEKTSLNYATSVGVLKFEVMTHCLNYSFEDITASAKITYSLIYEGEKTSTTTIEFEVEK